MSRSIQSSSPEASSSEAAPSLRSATSYSVRSEPSAQCNLILSSTEPAAGQRNSKKLAMDEKCPTVSKCNGGYLQQLQQHDESEDDFMEKNQSRYPAITTLKRRPQSNMWNTKQKLNEATTNEYREIATRTTTATSAIGSFAIGSDQRLPEVTAEKTLKATTSHEKIRRSSRNIPSQSTRCPFSLRSAELYPSNCGIATSAASPCPESLSLMPEDLQPTESLKQPRLRFPKEMTPGEDATTGSSIQEWTTSGTETHSLSSHEKVNNSHQHQPKDRLHHGDSTNQSFPNLSSHVPFTCNESSQESCFFDSYQEDNSNHNKKPAVGHKQETSLTLIGREEFKLVSKSSSLSNEVLSTSESIIELVPNPSSLEETARAGTFSTVNTPSNNGPERDRRNCAVGSSNMNSIGMHQCHQFSPDPPSYLRQRLNALHKQQQQRSLSHGTSLKRQWSKHSSPSAISVANSDSVIESSRYQHDRSYFFGTPKNEEGENKHIQQTWLHELCSTTDHSVTMNGLERAEVGYYEKSKFRKQEEFGEESRRPITPDTASIVPPRPNKTKSQLAALQEKIVKFEGQLQIESEHRKAAEEGKLNVLKEALGALERTLAAEVRRRVDANKTIQMGFEQQLTTLEDKIDHTLDDRKRQLSIAIESINSRLKEAETGVNEAIEIQTQRLRQLGDEIEIIASEIYKVKEHITNEFQARRQRGEIISDKLMELENQIENRVNIEKVRHLITTIVKHSVRERDVRKLNVAFEELKQHHIALDDEFQHELAAKFLELKNALKEETQAREQADDDIVQALNHYTVALQSALRIANSA